MNDIELLLEDLDYTEDVDNILYEDFISNLNIESDDDQSESITIQQAVIDYKNGITEAFDYIYCYYKPIVKGWSYRSAPNNMEMQEELFADMLDIQLLDCLEKYDSTVNCKFNTFYMSRFAWSAGAFKKKMSSKKRKANIISIDKKNTISDKSSRESDLHDVIADETSNSRMVELFSSIDNLKTISDRNKKMLKMIMLGYTYEEMAKEFGVTPATPKMFFKRFGTTEEGIEFCKLLRNI